jgi:hypothetical protein
MLTLRGGQVEVLWDEALPIEARELPEDLAGLDRVLRDPALLGPVREAWACSARDRGRPSIAIDVFVRLLVIKQRTGWGYETLVREVSDSLHLRRFCPIAIDQRVSDEVDRSRSIGRTVRAISKTLARRTGEAKAQVMALNEDAGNRIARSAGEAQRLAVQARAAARGRGAQATLLGVLRRRGRNSGRPGRSIADRETPRHLPVQRWRRTVRRSRAEFGLPEGANQSAADGV